jgi:hypothetical protein
MSSTVASAAEAMQAAFREGDFSMVADRLADDILFNSPVLERPWTSRAVVERLGPAMVAVLERIEFGPVVIHGRRAILPFSAHRGSVAVDAIEVMDVDDAGKIAELTIYIRPLPAVHAVAKGMQELIDPDLLAEHLRAGASG